MLGPVLDATQGDQIEVVAIAPIRCLTLWNGGGSGGVSVHDDTAVRILALLNENEARSPPPRPSGLATPPERPGMPPRPSPCRGRAYGPSVCLFVAAMENRQRLLAKRAAGLPKRWSCRPHWRAIPWSMRRR